jgi:hypothetical protein
MMAWEAAGRIGAFIELEGELVRRGAGLIFMRGTLRDGSRTLGTCQGTWTILSSRRRATPASMPA